MKMYENIGETKVEYSSFAFSDTVKVFVSQNSTKI